MFDEQQEAEETDQEDIYSEEGLIDQELDALLEYIDISAKQEVPVADKKESKEEAKADVAEKVEAKEEVKKEPEIVPKEDLLSQMMMMGFQMELSKKALI